MRYHFLLLTTLGLLALIHINNSPIGYALATPTPTPTIPTTVIELTLSNTTQLNNKQTHQLPQIRILSPQPNTSFTPAIIKHTPYAPPRPQTPNPNANPKLKPQTDLVDNWEALLAEDFETTFPRNECFVFDYNDDGLEYLWHNDDYKFANGSFAAWPSKGGLNGLDPEFNPYPPNQNGWLQCGPFTVNDTDKLITRYMRWLQLYDPDDSLFFGVSTGGNFSGLRTYGVQNWTQMETHINLSITPKTNSTVDIWLLWQFVSDGDTDQAEGVWLDNLEFWRYTQPTQTCGDKDFGNKGVVLPAYDPSVGGIAPIIRAGDVTALDSLIAADVRWVRWVFEQRNGSIDLQDYDRMVDTLCANNINVLAILNHQTIYDQNYNDNTNFITYTHQFTSTAAFLVNHYQNRITTWEVWNEQDYNPDPNSDPPLAPYMYENLYAQLLKATYQTIKSINPDTTVLYGGHSTAMKGSIDYFEKVLRVFDNGEFPADGLANHPYPDVEQENVSPELKSLNPNEYLVAESPTLLKKFTDALDRKGIEAKPIWITELGWNSAKGEANLLCQENKVVTPDEQATYLTDSFRILFNQATQPDGTTRAVEKIFWYQFMDVAIPEDLACPSGITASKGFIPTGYVPANYILPSYPTPLIQFVIVPWWFGLYGGDKQTPKPAQCTFANYPFACGQNNRVHFPMVLK